ncbi:MAG: hypothetical protein ACE5PV_20585 [Candidatus Poribacteria bacterium]
MVTLLTDNFEDCDVSDWNVGNRGEIYCDNARSHGGSYSGRWRRTGGGGVPEAWKNFTRQTSGLVTAIFWLNDDQAGAHTHLPRIRDSINGGHFPLRLHKSGYMQAYKNGAYINVYQYASDTWYKIKLEIDLDLNKYDVYIYDESETLLASETGCDPAGTVTGVDEINLRASDSGAYYAWIDDIEITGPDFTPKQGHFKWYKASWKAEDAQLTGVEDGDDLRFRVCIHETGGGSGSNLDIDVQYSVDKSEWIPLAAQGAGGVSWISPDGYEDPDADWTNEPKAYDDDESTYAMSGPIELGTWSGFLVLTLTNPLVSNKVRLLLSYLYEGITSIDVDVYRDGIWVHVYEGSWTFDEWVEKTFTAGSVSKLRVRGYNSNPMASPNLFVKEADFWKEERFRWRDDAGLAEHQVIDQAGLSCTTENGKVHEKACSDSENAGANGHHEISIILEPYAVAQNTTYYFRVVLEGTALSLDSEVTEFVNCKTGVPPPTVGYSYSDGLVCVQVAG